MGLGNPPAFVGKISVTSNNNELYWDEQTSGANTATLANAEYYPDALCSAISAAMSGASVAGNTYGCSFSVETGKYTISRLGGTEDFAIDPRTSQAGNIWIGGTQDSGGNTWSTDQYGPNFLGWKAAASLTFYASEQTSPNVAGVVWYPSQPPQDDDGGVDDSLITQATAMDGTTTTFDFTGWETSNDDANFPHYLGKNQLRRWRFRYITQESRDQYIQFWGPWAKTGGAFLFYPDYTDDSVSYEYKLTRESCQRRTFSERTVQGYPYYSGELQARGAA